MRIFLIAVGAVLALLVAAVLVGPSLIDWNAHKDRIVAEVREATGRDVSIQGTMSLSLLPVPALSAQGVRLAGIEGGGPEPLLALKELRVRVALLPLLQGTVQVERILLVEPEISLEVLADGRRNWSFAKDAEQAGQSAAPGAAGFDVRFDDVSIERGSLVYRDAASGREERVEDLNLRVVAESLRGPFAGKGELSLRGVAGSFEATLGRLVEEGATPFNMVMKPAGETGRLQVSGVISAHPDNNSVNGRVKGEGENLAALLAELLGGGKAASSLLAQPFLIQGELSVDGEGAEVSELDLDLGGARFAGKLTSALAPPFEAQLSLTAPQLDLDRWLAVQETGGQAGEETPDEPSAEAGGLLGGLPAEVQGRLELAVEAVILQGQLVRQLRVEAALAEGALQVERATALLPGSSDVSLTGRLQEVEGAAVFDGHLEAASDNLRGLLQWAGTDVGQVPADRLRRMSLTGRVTGTGDQIEIADLDLRLDLTRLSGGLVIAPRARPGLGIGLALDSINLDAYLPRRGEGGADGSGSTTAATAAGGLDLALLDRFDANLNLRAGAVTLGGATAKDLQVDATLQSGALEVRSARVGDLAGGSLDYTGRIDKIGSQPALDGKLQLAVPEPARLASLLALDPEALAALPALDGAGTLRGNLEELTLDAEAAGGEARLAVTGTLRPAAAPASFDLRLTGQHPDLSALLRERAGVDGLSGPLDLSLRLSGASGALTVRELEGTLGPVALLGGFDLALGSPGAAGTVVSDLDLRVATKHLEAGRLAVLVGLGEDPADFSGLGVLDLSAHLTGGGEAARLEDIDASAGPLQASGGIDLALSGLTASIEGFDLELTAKHEDLAALATEFGTDLNGDLGGLDLSARLRGDPQRLEIDGLDGSLGPVALAGRVEADLRGPRPAFVAELETGELPLDRLLGGSEASITAENERWSDDAIDLAGLGAFDGRLALRSAALTHGTLRLDNVNASARLEAGRLELERLAGMAHGGALELAGRFDLRGTLDAEVELTAIEIDLGDLLRAQADLDGLTGPLFFNGDFTARGASLAALVADLDGRGEFSGLLTLADSGEGEDPAGLSPILSQALGVEPLRLAGSFEAEAGSLRSEDIRLDGQPAFALTLATLDLPGWTVDGLTDVYERSTGEPLIASVAFGGPLDAPEVESLKLPSELVPALVEELAPEPEPSAEPAPEAAVAEPAVPLAKPEPEVAPQPEPQAEPQSEPGPAPQPTPEPALEPEGDDLLKDLLKLGS